MRELSQWRENYLLTNPNNTFFFFKINQISFHATGKISFLIGNWQSERSSKKATESVRYGKHPVNIVSAKKKLICFTRKTKHFLGPVQASNFTLACAEPIPIWVDPNN